MTASCAAQQRYTWSMCRMGKVGADVDVRPARLSTALLVRLQVPRGRDRRIELAVVLLRLVLELDLAVVERELARRQMGRAVRAAGRIGADDQVLERDHVIVRSEEPRLNSSHLGNS